ncbi:primosomal protein N' (replication factor Y) - superfamily II helicase [Ketogulonicigenium vulgare]|uniref:primosomal protein N' (replication factor Y) - superfamily II helicase n=1 Tax=Ketogulonicigenium vulgare TaxID=92945 RepID=UPI0023585091|nr:primosomal protein N' (replication factor Y) - superfamily II helicase [Ketogulonicigenium vulgare]
MTDLPNIPRRRRASAADTAEEHRFPCEQCGANLTFAPGQTELRCDHCGHVQHISLRGAMSDALRELDYNLVLANLVRDAEYETTRFIQCPNCGARSEFQEGTHAAACPFCATPVVTDTGAHRQIKPQALVPFTLDERAARDAMTKWLGSLWLAPNGLQEYARKGRSMSGIYVPYWTFDSNSRSEYTGQRGDIYYETRTVMRDGKRHTEQVQRIRWTRVSGQTARVFDDVLVLAENALPRDYTDALEPWDLSQLLPYDPQFLSGFRAEGYALGPEEGFDIGQQKMRAVIEGDVRRQIGGDRQQIDRLHVEHNDVTLKHVLLPIWVAAYKYRDKSYRFVVNAQTGKVKGERPWSAWKIFFLVLAVGALAAGVAFLGYNG